MEQFQDDCIFCQILRGSVPAKKVYEDEHCAAVLDINPAAPGHVLLLPKYHVPLFPQLGEDVVEHLGFVAKGLSRAMLQGLGVSGTNLFVANGAAAGQRAPHAMMHIIPRKEGDGLSLQLPEHKLPDQMKSELMKLAPVVAQVLGGAPPRKEGGPQPQTGEEAPPAEAKTSPRPEKLAEEAEKPVPKPSEPQKPEPPEPESEPDGGMDLDRITELLTK